MPHCVVLDNGTATIKAGFAGANFPTSVFPTMVGRPVVRAGEKVEGVEIKDIMVGDEAAKARAALEINFPFRAGTVKHWEDMERLWEYAFTEKLQIDPSDSKLMLTEPPLNSIKHREQLCEVMFEKFGFSHLFVGLQAVLVLYAQGLVTGIVVDSGDSVTHAVPVMDGTVLTNSVRRMEIGGRDITEYLIKLMLRRGYVFNKSADFELAQNLKEKSCYVACDMPLERRLAYDTCVLEQTHTLPDGQKVKIGPERFESSEPLFQPHLVDKDGLGITDLAYQSIQSAPIDCRMNLYEHFVLSGGSTLFPGLPTRLINELRQKHLVNAVKGDKSKMSNFKLKVEDIPRRKFLVFSGAAVLAQLMNDVNSDNWVSREDYAENGTRALKF